MDGRIVGYSGKRKSERDVEREEGNYNWSCEISKEKEGCKRGDGMREGL